jgi:hypothetical protein
MENHHQPATERERERGSQPPSIIKYLCPLSLSFPYMAHPMQMVGVDAETIIPTENIDFLCSVCNCAIKTIFGRKVQFSPRLILVGKKQGH